MAGNPRRLFFTRLGVLATARLALSACDRPKASDITEPQQAAHVLACCLMMNELTSSTAPMTDADRSARPPAWLITMPWRIMTSGETCCAAWSIRA